MVRYIFSWLWAIPALAQVQSFHPQGHDEVTYSFNVPDNTAKSGSGPIYFQMNSTRQVQWFAMGQGRQMAGANMFVVYTSGNNVTVSPRSGAGEIQPLYNKDTQIEILNGSGVHDGVITANVQCDTCLKWNGGTENVNSSSSPWIWAIKYGESLNSVNVSENITHHDDHGVMLIDLQRATGGSSVNPFAQMDRVSISPNEEDPEYVAFRNTIRRKKTAHAVLMVLAFVVMFPFFALGLHVFPSKWTVSMHGMFQLLTLAVAIAGLGVGVSMARQIELIDSYHTILGMIIAASLALFQPTMVALGVALTPTVLHTLISHYLNRKSLHNKPTVHVTYDEGIQIVRQFLFYASKHPVEDLQAFTRQWVPTPHWVRTETITIPDEFLSSAAEAVTKQLGHKGVIRVGGEKWWQWRGPAEELRGSGLRCGTTTIKRRGLAGIRHARKLKGRVFAPEYRLSPQFPFPCGLHDCLAAYLWLLKSHEPKEIILAGDSAGGGMALSMLVIMRDQGIPLPAGAILISPWVDLTHSFPSIVEDNPGDYIPAYGFRHKPSAAWPPPNADDILKIKRLSRQPRVTAEEVKKAIPQPNSTAEETAIRGYTVHENTSTPAEPAYPGLQQAPSPDTLNAEPDNIHVVLDGKTVELKDQIQLYTTNQLMSHPLVSPVLQPSLGGLPPLHILSGGGETLRDEQFYMAHKAANPTAYPPSDAYLDENDPTRETLNKYEPTYVQFQVWDDLCHVAPTLSFTRPAKYMFRSIAQFGSWALARAQNGEVEIMDDSAFSAISSSSSEDEDIPGPQTALSGPPGGPGPSSVGKAGDPLPAFHEHMIRQRIDKRGHVFQLDPPSSYPVLNIPPAEIGAINPVLIQMWLDAKKEWDIRFAKEKLRVQTRRLKELAHGFQDFDGECPPPSSLAARRAAPGVLPKRHAKKNYGMMMWSGWGSRHDERRIEMEKRAEESGKRSTRVSIDAGQAGAWSSTPATNPQTEKVLDQDPTDNNSQSNGYTAVSWDEKEHHNNGDSSTGRISTDPETFSRPHSEKSAGPILILPGVNNNKFTDENASTRSLFHAAGTLPMKSELSLAHSRYRPTSAAGSGTGRSEMMSDTGSTVDGDKDYSAFMNMASDNASSRAVMGARGVIPPMIAGENDRSEMMSDTGSTVGGDKDSVTYMNMGSDNASNRAVIGARGVISPMMAGENGRRSTDTLSVFSATGRDSMSLRPEMLDREIYKTAE
ncbi:Alpha/beta hydrolase fold-3 [Penicillium fimorum]|uniref:Alpha/beta hydrolase fold-3 n=1 Tax=Penicillium fimorum TaxID=1882269 RepID=A0A9W9XXE9_9EURO|nr:Alpha/beta hydrolase fold-3 [Penicillium fimorum]